MDLLSTLAKLDKQGNQLKLCMFLWLCLCFQVFLVRKITDHDAGTLYAMKVLKKATLKGTRLQKGIKCKEFLLHLTKRHCDRYSCMRMLLFIPQGVHIYT